MRYESLFRRAVPLTLLTLLFAVTAFGQTSASLSGIVQDPNGGVVNGAKVIVSDPSKGLQLETTTNSEGIFAFPALQPGTYTVTIEANGFKKFVKSGVVLNVADKQSTGRITLEVGGFESTVQVTADAAQLLIKTESGEQSQVINGEQIANLALNGRNFLDLVKLTPGVTSFVNGQEASSGGLDQIWVNGMRRGSTNVTIDGSTNIDTGSNGSMHVALVLDNIAEFKILTSNYQAEYGRTSGGAIQLVTKGGSKDFHGTGYYFHRHEQFNANDFFQNSFGGNRANYRYNYQGFNLSGPVMLPKKLFGPLGNAKIRERVFWFYSQEWQEQLRPSGSGRARVPTADEVNGNFAGAVNGNNQPITLYDPLTGQPFPGNVIPANRINPNGQAILRKFASFANFNQGLPVINHNSVVSSIYPRRQYNIRVDANITDNTHAFIRYTRDADKKTGPFGFGWIGGWQSNIPFDTTIFETPGWNGSYNLTTALSPTLTNEFVFGASQNKLLIGPTDPDKATYSGYGFNWQMPFPYPADAFIGVSFGGVTGLPFASATLFGPYPYKNSNTTFDIYDNVSKVWGTHTLKAGIYVNRSRKDQTAGTTMTINFNPGNNPEGTSNLANPANTGHPFADALLGAFNTLTEPTRGLYQGQFRSTNVEWYLQDNWKVTRRLTLDYGLRFSFIQPQYDQLNQGAFFDPARYDRGKAVRLYVRDPKGSGSAVDPANPDVRLQSYLIGRIVPGSGDPFNGMVQVGKGVERGGYKNRGIQYSPAFGFAYDVFGNNKTVVRGGYRIGYDRVSGGTVAFPGVENPPTFVNPTFNFGNLATVGASSGQPALGVLPALGVDPEGFVPNVQSFSLQAQQDVGFNTVVSVGYVGTLSRHMQEQIDLNAIPYGYLFTKAAQDPSRYSGGIVPDEEPNLPQLYRDAGLKFTGRFAHQPNFIRNFPGYGQITYKTFGGSSNYHSLQATVQRRMSKGISFGAAYTWGKALGTVGNGNTTQSSFINIVCSRCYDYQTLMFDRKHSLVINYIWDLPKVKWNNWLARKIVNDWQITGITQFFSGTPLELGYDIQGISTSQFITGSWTEGPRPIVTGNAQPTKEFGKALDFTQVRMPDLNPGPQPRSFIRNPGINITDLSVFKNFSLGGDGSRSLQLRLEAFNAFNHPQFVGIVSRLTFFPSTNFALGPDGKSQFLSNYRAFQQASPNTVNNVRGGARPPSTNLLGFSLGEFTGSQPGYVSGSRVVQLAVKIFF